MMSSKWMIRLFSNYPNEAISKAMVNHPQDQKYGWFSIADITQMI
jgi:hypothetical protein